MLKLLAFVFGVIAMSTKSVYADYRNPTDAYDCSYGKTPAWKAMMALSDDFSACIKKFPGSPDPNHPRFHAAIKTSCYGSLNRQCAPIKERQCSLEKQAYALAATCRLKLAEKRLHEKELKRVRDEFERVQQLKEAEIRQRELEESSQQTAQRNEILQGGLNAAVSGEGLGPAAGNAKELQLIPRQIAKLMMGDVKGVALQRSGLKYPHMAYQAAHGKFPNVNASSLSWQMSKIGTRFILGMQTAAQQDLMDAMARFDETLGNSRLGNQSSIFNANNPRPFATQLDDAYALNDEVQAHIERVSNAVLRLPVDGQSMVNTGAGNLLNEIVQARVNGDISSLSNAMTEYVSFVKKDALAAFEEARGSPTSDVDFTKQRLAVLETVETEVRRIAAVAAANVRKKDAQARSSSRAGTTNRSDHSESNNKNTLFSSPKTCLKVTGSGQMRNVCNRAVRCRWGGLIVDVTFLAKRVHVDPTVTSIMEKARCSY